MLRLARAGLAGLLLLAAAPPRVAAATPTVTLRQYADEVIRILQDPALQGDEKKPLRRARVRQIADQAFDFEEMSRRALGLHWRERSPAERRRFVGLFAALLDRAYFATLDSYAGEEVRYLNEERDGDLATVKTIIVTQNRTQVPVDYRMRRVRDRWLVYDVAVEGVSLIANYRTQFNRVIRTSSYQELVRRIEEKATGPDAPAVKKP